MGPRTHRPASTALVTKIFSHRVLGHEMHLFLIRHGETEHNVAGLLAGVTDSRLTNHGALQTQRLGTFLVKDRGLNFTHIYSSDLQRAFITANEICKSQQDRKDQQQHIEVVQLEVLREQDFGSLELVSWTSRKAQEAVAPSTSKSTKEDFKPKETPDAMKLRAIGFLDDYLTPLFAMDEEEPVRVAVVSHGLFLGQLWRVLLSKFKTDTIIIDPGIIASEMNMSIDHISWSNTGYLELDIDHKKDAGEQIGDESLSTIESQNCHSFSDALMTIISMNDKRHLANLKRSRGGIGSAAFDQRQQKVNQFFKKPKIEPKAPE